MNKVYEYVQRNIISQLKEAIKNGTCVPWEKPWIGTDGAKNYITHKSYRGINTLLLPIEGEYITFRQIKKLQMEKKYSNIKLKKGSKSYMVVFWKFYSDDKNDDDNVNITEITNDDNEKKAPIFRYYRVFHISSVEGLNPHDDIMQSINANINTDEEAEKIIDRYSHEVPINKVFGGNSSFYDSFVDEITVPDPKQFKEISEFYSTVFHEMVHSTGHEGRLSRFNKDANQFIFGSNSYSKEELVAEIGASMLMAQLGLSNKNTNKNSVAYLESWLNAIENDVTLITFAAQQAQKAVDFINNKTYGEELEKAI